MMRVKSFFASFLFLLLSSFTQAQSDTLTSGAAWPGLSLTDQHDRKVELNPSRLRYLLFAAERKPGDWAQTAIENGRKDLVASGQMALVLDVSRMPALVTRLFAMPSFRERTFPILVAREAEPVAILPRKEGAVTLLTLDTNKVAAIDYAGDEAALEQLLTRTTPQPTTREKP